MNLSLNVSVCLMIFLIHLTSSTSIDVDKFYPEERDALIQLRDSLNSTLNLHSIWTGPPCYNDNSNWFGIVCSNWHVIQVVLEGIQLTGSLPPTFLKNLTLLSKLSLRNNLLFGPLPNLASLVNLQFISFSHNSFSGSIPFEFVELPRLTLLELQENLLTGNIPPFDQPTLTVFNVSTNFLEGPIPETPVLQSFSESSYDNNSGLCGKPLGRSCPLVPSVPVGAPPPLPSPSQPSKKKKKNLTLWSIILIAVVAALVPFMVMLVFLCYHRKVHGKGTGLESTGEKHVDRTKKKMRSSMNTGDPEKSVELDFFDKERPTFNLDDLLRASAKMLGKGQLGSTYKATLESGCVIAVKRLKELNGLNKKEFVQQIQLLGKLRHENLVEIISFYYSKEEKLIVYEYVPNGSLFELLHENRGVGRVALNWTRRLAILKGIAKGLTYLHQYLPSHKVPHANLKSSNVLIDDSNQNYQAKLTDFGSLPLLPFHKASKNLAIGRTPEFSQGKKLTHRVDVYCFGIILLEVITGRNPGEFSQTNEDPMEDLSDWVRSVVNNDWSTDILDLEILAEKEGHNEMLKLTEIALECTSTTPEKRPKMSEVLRRIEEIEKGNNKERG